MPFAHTLASSLVVACPCTCISFSSGVLESVLPARIKHRGWSKGRGLAVVCLPKKRRCLRPTPFLMKAPLERAIVMLRWFVEEHVAQKAITGLKIEETGIEVTLEKILSPALNEKIDLNEIWRFFTDDGWVALTATITQKRNFGSWTFSVCKKQLHDDSIGCDACREWLHFKCARLTSVPRNKPWICRNCYAWNCVRLCCLFLLLICSYFCQFASCLQYLLCCCIVFK